MIAPKNEDKSGLHNSKAAMKKLRRSQFSFRFPSTTLHSKPAQK